MNNWLNSLTDLSRDNVFTEMRRFDNIMTLQYWKSSKLAPPFGSIGVGAADFDPLIRAESIRVFLSGIRGGQDPSNANVLTKSEVRLYILKHNNKRPKDINWQRWEGMEDANIENMTRSLISVSDKQL